MTEFFTSRWTTITSFIQTQHFNPTDLKNLFTWYYWTEPALNPASSEYLPVTFLVTILIIGLLVWRFRAKKAQLTVLVYEPIISHLASLITFIIIIAISYLFFRTQSLAYLSSRLVPLITLIIVAIWLGWLVFYQLRIIPRLAKDYLEQERFFRYIPKSNAKVKRQKSK